MADSDTTQTTDHNDEPQKPLSPAARKIGEQAAAEQRELLALLIDNGDEFSGFAKRGILVRILDLADVSACLFEGGWDTLLEVAIKVHGSPHAAIEGMKAEEEATHE